MNSIPLTVVILSFSYKNVPDWSSVPHGGGFVFDCRGLPNPGREEQFRYSTGLDPEVQNYLRRTPEFEPFFKASLTLVEQTLAHHQRRGFDRLTVAYGCTGGQHRSVFCAETLAHQLRSRVPVEVNHRQAALWPAQS